MRVQHLNFGKGTVITIEGTGANKKACVAFDGVGTKQLMLRFARLKIIYEE